VKKSGWWKGALQYALGFGLLGYMVYKYRDGLSKQFQQTPNLDLLLVVAAVFVGCTAVQYYRWYLLVRALDLPFTFRNAVRLGMVGTFYNTFLPGSVGGDLVKAFFIARDQPGRRAAAVATVVADRLFGLFGLILFIAAVGGGCWAAGDERIAANGYLQTVIRVSVGVVIGTVLAWLGLGFLPQARADRFAGRLHRVPKVGATLAELWYTVWQYRQRPRAVASCIALSAVVHTGFVFMFHTAVRVFPPADAALLGTLPEHFVIAPIGFIGQAFFPAPGGVGGGEAIFGYLYELIRGEPGNKELNEAAATVGVFGRMTIRLCEWTFGLVGYLAFLRMRRELPVAEAEAAAEEADPYEEHPAEAAKDPAA
jgi:uncharacterized membrane protein YbhN (UPF0104 family)